MCLEYNSDLLRQSKISELFTAAPLEIHPGPAMADSSMSFGVKIKQSENCYRALTSKLRS